MSYPNYGYGVGYGTNPYFQGYQQPFQPNQFMNMNRQEQAQPMRNTEQPIRTVPFSEVLYGTYEQAKSRVVFPNNSALIINPDKNEAYVTSADQDGKPHFKTYKFISQDKLTKESETEPASDDFFVKREELTDFLTKKDLNGLLTTKDLNEINEKLERLQRKLEINKLEKEIKK